MNTHNPLVSILIPVYNAAATLPQCLESLEQQTYGNLEFVFVNDRSTDSSASMLQDFASKIHNRKVLTLSHLSNQGAATARNTALEHASGEYIYWLDADDRLEPSALELMVDFATSQQLDVVGIEWFLTFNVKERRMRQAPFDTPIEALSNIMMGIARWNLWLFMAKRSLYKDHHIRFTPGWDMGEDLFVMTQVLLHARSARLLPKALYHYRQCNEQSLTRTYSERHRQQVTHNVEATEAVLRQENQATLVEQMKFLKLNIKLPLLISDQTSNYELWNHWFAEANDAVTRNPRLPWRTRSLQWLALHRHYWLVKGYYRFIYKWVYGVVYK